jgi:hypothetical protein
VIVAVILPLLDVVLVALVAYATAAVIFGLGAWRAGTLARRGAPRACANRAPPAIAAPTTIAFLGDVQRGIREVAGPVVLALARERVSLLVSSGDLSSHGEAPYHGVVGAAFDRAGLAVPLLVAPGNHDVEPSGQHDPAPGRRLFEAVFGPRRWTARVGPLLVVGVDDGVDPLDADLWPWMNDALAAHEGPWLFVGHRPQRSMLEAGTPAGERLEPLMAVFAKRPPVVAISGHLSRDAEAVVDGVRYVVNAEGGDVDGGTWLAPPTFRLLLADVDAAGGVSLRRMNLARRTSWRAALDQFLVRLWSDGRRLPGALVAAPGRSLLRLVGCRIP